MLKEFYARSIRFCLPVVLVVVFGVVSSGEVAGQSEIIISQYIETSSGTTPKGIEVYNVSGADIVFSASNNLEILQGSNGASCNSIVNIISGTLAADEVWVIGTSNLTSYAASNGSSLSGTSLFGFQFNGDDALTLELGGQIQDMFGDCGNDPGSAWSGLEVSTANENIQIQDGICDGDIDGWTDPSTRFDYVADGQIMTGFGDAPPSCSGTKVQFESIGVSLSENGGSIEICVDIQNANADTATTVDVALTGSGSPHLSSFTAASLTFPAGSSEQECVTITITDDLICGNSQDYTLSLSNVDGPTAVAIGSQDEFILSITDDDGSSGTIVKQGFEGDATETFAFTNSGGSISTTNSGTPSNQRIRSGSKSFQSNNTTSTLNFDAQDISAYTNVDLVIWNSSISLGGSGNGADAGDYIKVYVSETASFASTPNISLVGNGNAKYGMNGTLELNVSAPATISHTTSTGTLNITNSPSKMVISVPDAWNGLYTKIEIKNNSANEVWCLDDIRLTGITCDACVDPTITSINPTSGPKETVVNIVGTNFITGGALTDVQFGGVSASSYNVISDTEMTAVVPADAITGVVKVLRGSCNDLSSETFTFLEEDCETGTASLIISELCDPDNFSGTDRFIEIYNPSDVTIDLTGWQLYSLSNQTEIYSPASSNPGLFWNLSGTIAPGEALTCGYTMPIKGGPHDFTNVDWNNFTVGAGSYNWNGKSNDGAALFHNGVLIDGVLIDPDNTYNVFKDKSLIRNDDVCASNPNSTISEWTPTANVGDANLAPATPRSHYSSCILLTGADPTVISASTSNISEPVCNQPDITITATSGSVISYQWYYNDGSASWTEIIDNAVFSGATTPTLSITNLVGLEDYQFYCRLITDLACINYSRAIQVEVLPNDKIYFKSKNSGLWSDPATWEFSTDIFDTYSDACIYPNSTNSVLVEIETGQVVTYDLANTDTIPSVWVLSGSTLQTQSNRNLRIDNVDPTAELIVDGTYIDNATSSSSIAFLNGATWELGAFGTIVKTNTSSVTQYRDNYEDGISNIPSSSTWIYRYTGIGDLSFANSTISVPMHYPNLILENETAGTYSSIINPGNINLSTFTMTGGEPMTIKGSFDVGGAGTGSVNFSNINNGTSPILVKGELIVRDGSTLRNTGTDAPSEGVGFEVQGNMDIEGTLDLSAGDNDVNVGILKLSGSETKYTYGPAGPAPLNTVKANHLIIDLAVDEQIYSDLNFEVDESATFTQGILELSEDANVITFNSEATVSGASNASFVDGKVIKVLAADEDEFTFPIGDIKDATNKWYQPARIFGTSGAATIEAEYFAEEEAHAGLYYDGDSNTPGDNQEIGNCDYWAIDKISGSNVRLGFAFRNADPEYCNDIGDENYLSLARWNGSAWFYPIDEGVDPVNVPDEISSIALIQNYGHFVLASTGGDNFNVLPITLLSFTAEAEENQVLTSWITASELNNDYFTIERSADAKTFKSIGTVEGAGTSHSKRSYSFADDAPLSGVSYYRLRQTDYDGTNTLSEIRSVEFYNSGNFSLDMAYRSEEGMSLAFTSTSPYLTVEIFDVFGQLVYGGLVENYGGRATIKPRISRGVYVVRLSQGSKSDSRKVFW